MDKSYVLIRPLSSEKQNHLANRLNRLTLEVHPDANKVQIKKAVEEMFNVSVVAVNIVRVRPRPRVRQGRVIGRVPGYKKAFVKLAPGDIDKIDFMGV